jgi:hypothetical protein
VKRKKLFTHCFYSYLGWQETKLTEDSFKRIQIIFKNKQSEIIFLGVDKNGKSHLLKGHYNE